MTTPTSSTLAVRPNQEFWNATQLAALRQIGVQDAHNGDLAVFLNYAQRTGLDPFARQIYMIGRRQKVGNDWTTKWTIQAGIDGLRIVAERSGDYAGQVGPEYCGPDGVWCDVWTKAEAPVASRVGVLRKGFTAPLYAVAYYDEYVQAKDGKPTSMWASKPLLMLAKCAEALALRKAFPNDLSGIYTAEEMDAAGHTYEHAPEHPAEPEPTIEDAIVVEETGGVIEAEIIEEAAGPAVASPAQLKAIATILGKCGVKERDERHDVILALIGHQLADAHDLTKAEAHKVIETIMPLSAADDPVAAYTEWRAKAGW